MLFEVNARGLSVLCFFFISRVVLVATATRRPNKERGVPQARGLTQFYFFGFVWLIDFSRKHRLWLTMCPQWRAAFCLLGMFVIEGRQMVLEMRMCIQDLKFVAQGRPWMRLVYLQRGQVI